MSGIRVDVQHLGRHFQKGGNHIQVLTELNLTVQPGERMAIVGQSGSGKSTLMHLLGLLDRPSNGCVLFDGKNVGMMAASLRDRVRNRRIGFVFQAHNLLPEKTALENVMLPVQLSGAGNRIARIRAKALLEAVGLAKRLAHQPGELSGGEQQRVAIARALVMGPGLVLADEPTGNLDPTTADEVFGLFMDLNKQLGSTLIVVTHSLEMAARFPRVGRMKKGMLIEQ